MGKNIMDILWKSLKIPNKLVIKIMRISYHNYFLLPES